MIIPKAAREKQRLTYEGTPIRLSADLSSKMLQAWDFPGGTVVKNSPANAGDKGSSPGPGRSHMPRSN